MKMTFEVASLEIKESIDSDDLKNLETIAEKIETGIKSIKDVAEAEHSRTKEALAVLEGENTILDEKVKSFESVYATPEEAQSSSDKVKRLMDDKVKDVIKWGQMCGIILADKVDEYTKLTEKYDVDELNLKKAEYVKLFNDKHPNLGELESNLNLNQEDREVNAIPDSRFSTD